MSSLLTTYESNLGTVATAAQERVGEPSWLADRRAAAARVFQEHGVPSTKHEEWKYTALRDFAGTEWSVAPRSSAAEIPPAYDPTSARIVLVNGYFEPSLSDIQGVDVLSLGPALEADPQLLEAKLGRSTGPVTQAVKREIRPDVYPFGELNTALFADLVVLRLKDLSSRVIEIVHVQDCSAGSLTAPRLLVVAEPGSTARIVETYVTQTCEPSACLPVTEVYVGEGANLTHVRVQAQCMCNTHIALWQTVQDKDSTYTSFNVCFGSRLARVDQVIWIGGEGCTTRLDGVVAAGGEQHIDNHTRLDHAVPNCNSFEIYKQVIADRATAVFNGKIFVHQDAQKTDAKQTNQAILLSPDATIDSKPQLEIFADDVKCTHGATVGQLEDLPMFYMRQRGISEDVARAVLVRAFAAEVLELIEIEPVRRALEKRLSEKLGVDLD